MYAWTFVKSTGFMLCSGHNQNCKRVVFLAVQVFVAAWGLSPGLSPLSSYSLKAAHCGGVSWLPGSRAQAQQLWQMALVLWRHLGSFWPRGWTHVSCTGRQILYHWATREAWNDFINVIFSCWNLVFSPSKSSEALCYIRRALKSIEKVVNLDVARKSIAIGAYS